MDKIKRIKELTEQLHKASIAYYRNDNPIYTDKQYDEMYDELEQLEKEMNFVLANSPTKKVQGFILEGLNKVTHSRPMLSSNKTKDINEVKNFIGNRSAMSSYKMDGLTLVTRYSEGKLIKAITRGDGEEGEDVTEQSKMISNIPLTIPFDGQLELRGECVISWENFNKINESLEEPYSHPRNLAAGSLRTLDTNITKERKLEYVVFELVSYNNDDTYKTFGYRNQTLNWLDSLGFTTVERVSIPAPGCETSFCFENSMICTDVNELVSNMTAENTIYPVDGLIFNYENLSYAASLGSTAHHPLDMIALKWQNETFETELLDIEWNTTRTGRINPTAIFKPVLIEGSSVSRATVHNVSIMEELRLGKGDTITVYKSNQIIPAIDENLTMSGTFEPPLVCPCCGKDTEIHNENGTKTLHCTNPDCEAKLLSKLSHAVSKNALNIDGMSEATLEFMIEEFGVKSIKDLYQIPFYKEVYERWIETPGFGKRSVDKLRDAISKSRNTTLERFLYAQSINLIGKSASKDISKYCNGDIDKFCDIMANSNRTEFLSIDGFGKEMLKSLEKWADLHWIEFLALKSEFKFENTQNTSQNNKDTENNLNGKSFCITGKLEHYVNREELVGVIETNGGRYVTGVTSKTDYLINNDVTSTTGKNKKAQDLGKPIISEQDFMKMIGVI